MPLFEYKCPRCGRFEILQKYSDPSLMACPTCGKEVHRLLSAPAIQFKGTGWYITDYARKSSGGDGSAEGSSSSNSKEAKEAKPATEAKGSKDTASSSSASATSKDGSASGSSPSK
ncbi:MAG TPA: zinc ribbon domain-containing protein [Vicinamibacteria bacterium]|nr:zinc ribbon domain-containing protein [Vicinamibacteria bacterium]